MWLGWKRTSVYSSRPGEIPDKLGGYRPSYDQSGATLAVANPTMDRGDQLLKELREQTSKTEFVRSETQEAVP